MSKDPGRMTVRQIVEFLKFSGNGTMKLVGRDGAGKVTFLVVMAVEESARDLDPIITEFEESKG